MNINGDEAIKKFSNFKEFSENSNKLIKNMMKLLSNNERIENIKDQLSTIKNYAQKSIELFESFEKDIKTDEKLIAGDSGLPLGPLSLYLTDSEAEEHNLYGRLVQVSNWKSSLQKKTEMFNNLIMDYKNVPQLSYKIVKTDDIENSLNSKFTILKSKLTLVEGKCCLKSIQRRIDAVLTVTFDITESFENAIVRGAQEDSFLTYDDGHTKSAHNIFQTLSHQAISKILVELESSPPMNRLIFTIAEWWSNSEYFENYISSTINDLTLTEYNSSNIPDTEGLTL